MEINRYDSYKATFETENGVENFSGTILEICRFLMGNVEYATLNDQVKIKIHKGGSYEIVA